MTRALERKQLRWLSTRGKFAESQFKHYFTLHPSLCVLQSVPLQIGHEIRFAAATPSKSLHATLSQSDQSDDFGCKRVQEVVFSDDITTSPVQGQVGAS